MIQNISAPLWTRPGVSKVFAGRTKYRTVSNGPGWWAAFVPRVIVWTPELREPFTDTWYQELERSHTYLLFPLLSPSDNLKYTSFQLESSISPVKCFHKFIWLESFATIQRTTTLCILFIYLPHLSIPSIYLSAIFVYLFTLVGERAIPLTFGCEIPLSLCSLPSAALGCKEQGIF